MHYKDIIKTYKHHYNPTLSLLFEVAECPVEYTGKGCRLFDEQGNSYLDFCSAYGALGIGYQNERVQEAVMKQLDTMASAPYFLYNSTAAGFMNKLAGILPGDLNRIVLTGSASEAMEIAIRTVRLARPQRKGIVSAINSYHGKTLGALSVLGQDHLRKPFGSLLNNVNYVPYGNIDAIVRAIGKGVLAVILEPILGGGFIETPPPGYLTQVRELCHRTGTLLVVDEVQTGFGRTGKMFAIEHEQVHPDIIILSKGTTGGHTPMAAMVMTDSLAHDIGYAFEDDPFQFGTDNTTYPLICAAASAAIDVIMEENLPQNAAVTGTYMIGKLKEIAALYPHFIHDVPGCALMAGIKLRNCLLENAVWLQLLKRNVIGGLSTNTHTKRPIMRWFPPLIVTKEEVDIASQALYESLEELDRMPSLVYDLANQVQAYQYYLPKPFLKFGSGLLKNPPLMRFRKSKKKAPAVS
ncbi:MAG: aspartate aminotransferase family protein [Chitinophagaceae bacterium]